MVIKYFFPESHLAASVTAMLTEKPSLFTITAIENSTVLEYDFFTFKKLFSEHPDIALFYIKYLEQHWIIEKEPLEISFRADTVKTKYQEFLDTYPQLVKRLKKTPHCLGFNFNPQFTDEKGSCMVISDSIFVMLLTEPYFATFTKKTGQRCKEYNRCAYYA